MKTRLFIIAACVALLVCMMVLPASAAEIHSGVKAEWTDAEGVQYGIAGYPGIQRTYPPLYVTWDDGIVFMFDADDGGNDRFCFYELGTPNNYTLDGSHKYGMTKVTLENKTYYYYKFAKDFTVEGLSFASLEDFYRSFDKGGLNVYYLETAEADWDTAVSLAGKYETRDGVWNILDDVTTLFTAAFGFVATVATTVVGNPILLLFAVLGLVGLGVGLFVRLKNVSR